MPERRRLGIRALLLALLIPAMAALLAFDAWTDHRAISRAVIDAHDQILIEPVQALDYSLHLDASGHPQLSAAFSVQSMFDSTRSRYKALRVSATPLADTAGAPAPAQTQTLLGPAALPSPPPGPEGVVRFYDAEQDGRSLRIAALERSFHSGGNAPGWRVLIQAAEGTALRDQVLADAWHLALRNDLVTMALMVLLVWIGIALSLRPLERLRRALAARRPGDLEPLDTAGVPHEVAPLVEAVNAHVASQGRMLQAQRRFLADASHQLRTPIAIMLTQAGYALREREPAAMRETLRAIAAQLARARRLSEQLLALAQASEDPPPPRAGTLVDLAALARDVVLEYLPLAREKQQDLGWEGGDADPHAAAAGNGVDDADIDGDEDPDRAPAVPVLADAAELHEALANLVHNAINYTPAHGRITVAVRRHGGFAEAEVCDSGPGIAAALRETVFERFQRGAAAAEGTGEAAESPGAGLGLAIARAYARRNGGEILLGDAPATPGEKGGLRAVLRLPLHGAHPISDNTYFGARPSH